MFLSINQNIGNFANKVVLFLNKKTITEQSPEKIEVTTDELNLSLIKNIEHDTVVREAQDLNNADIQRDLKREFLREVQYFSSYAEFIEKFLDNPKFSNVLTKKVDHQDLSEIETILLNSIMEHLELLSRFESFGEYFYRFLADPLDGQYYPEREDFETEQEYEKSMQEHEKEQAETSRKFETRYQEYVTLIADSLVKIEQQLSEPNQEVQDMKLAS